MNLAQHVLLGAVQLYRWTVSPAQVFFFGAPGGCRFTPSCSQYALDAVREHGALTGSRLTAARLCRCHPWGGGGNDPVPPKADLKPAVSLPVPAANLINFHG